MEKERARVIEYINNKKEADLLVDVAIFWSRKEENHARKEEQSRRLDAAREWTHIDTSLQ